MKPDLTGGATDWPRFERVEELGSLGLTADPRSRGKNWDRCPAAVGHRPLWRDITLIPFSV